MTWQSNLLNTLLVVFILSAIFAIIYCKVKGVTLVELFKEIKQMVTLDG